MSSNGHTMADDAPPTSLVLVPMKTLMKFCVCLYHIERFKQIKKQPGLFSFITFKNLETGKSKPRYLGIIACMRLYNIGNSTSNGHIISVGANYHFDELFLFCL